MSQFACIGARCAGMIGRHRRAALKVNRFRGKPPARGLGCLTLFLEGLNTEYVGRVHFQGLVRSCDQVRSVRIDRFVGAEDC